jgi:subtilisin family serine protease
MSAHPSDDFDYGLPSSDDCWHLDAPHEATISLKRTEPAKQDGGMKVVLDPILCYKRVGINARDAWDGGKEGEGIRVVIFDTGVEIDHPSLAPNISREMAIDFDHSVRGSGIKESEGGRIANQFNAHGTACAGIVAAVKPGQSTDPKCRVVGVAPKASLVPVRIGTNFKIELLIAALKYARENGDIILMPRFMPETDDTALQAGDQSARDAIQVRHDGTQEAPPPRVADLIAAIRETATMVPVICASGNDGSNRLVNPARLVETIAVGACNDRGYRSTYSQFGDGLDVVAPSNDLAVEDLDTIRLDPDEADIRHREALELKARLDCKPLPPFKPRGIKSLQGTKAFQDKFNRDKIGLLSISTADNLGDFGYNFEPAGDYCKATGDFGFGGTSAAAAQVAGVVALMLAANKNLEQKPEAVRDLLRKAASYEHLLLQRGIQGHPAAKMLPEAREEFGHGLINAFAAVQLARMLDKTGKLPSNWEAQLGDLRRAQSVALA